MNAIADEAFDRGTGARGLRSICERILLDVMYDLPEHTEATRVLVTADNVVNGTIPPIVSVDALQDADVAVEPALIEAVDPDSESTHSA